MGSILFGSLIYAGLGIKSHAGSHLIGITQKSKILIQLMTFLFFLSNPILTCSQGQES